MMAMMVMMVSVHIFLLQKVVMRATISYEVFREYGLDVGGWVRMPRGQRLPTLRVGRLQWRGGSRPPLQAMDLLLVCADMI